MTTIDTTRFQFALSAIEAGLADIRKGEPKRGAAAIRRALTSLKRNAATEEQGSK